MKKVFLALAVVAAVLVSCKKVETTSSTEVTDSTAVQVDSVQVDSVQVDSVTVETPIKIK
jgi:outer membrane lipoprotein SlyB